MSHLPRLFTTCMVCLLSEKSEITQATTKTLKVTTAKTLTSEFQFNYMHIQ